MGHSLAVSPLQCLALRAETAMLYPRLTTFRGAPILAMALAAGGSCYGLWLHGGESTIVLPVRPSRRVCAGGRGALHAMLPMLLMLFCDCRYGNPLCSSLYSGGGPCKRCSCCCSCCLAAALPVAPVCPPPLRAPMRGARPLRGFCGLGPLCRWRAGVASSGVQGLAHGRSSWLCSHGIGLPQGQPMSSRGSGRWHWRRMVLVRVASPFGRRPG